MVTEDAPPALPPAVQARHSCVNSQAGPIRGVAVCHDPLLQPLASRCLTSASICQPHNFINLCLPFTVRHQHTQETGITSSGCLTLAIGQVTFTAHVRKKKIMEKRLAPNKRARLKYLKYREEKRKNDRWHRRQEDVGFQQF